jgi:hypothetical protein
MTCQMCQHPTDIPINICFACWEAWCVRLESEDRCRDSDCDEMKENHYHYD